MSLFLGNLFRYFFPEYCRHCNERVAEENSLFCRDCLGKIKIFSVENRCPLCGEDSYGICSSCQQKEIFFSKSKFIYLYEETAISLMRELKFQDSFRAWEIVKSDLDKKLNFENNIVFITMPSTKKFVLQIGKYLAQKFQGYHIAHFFSFQKEKETKKLNLANRFWHLEKMGIADVNLPMAKKYILVDDIYTTGATLNKGARLLVEKKSIPIENIEVFALFRRIAQRRIPRQ